MAATTQTGDRGGRLGYLPGLDGLRAVAVSAVFLFHAGVVPGGFLGVDVFFVISGFLITALAIGEIERTGTLSIAGFWGRRARRLLPALYLLVAAVVVWALIDGVPDGFGRDVAATLAYVANWVRVGDGYEYFAAYEQPSLLEHTWSLAVEEQFYLVWPVIIVITVAAARRRNWSPRAAIAVVAAFGAVASTAWSWWLAESGSAPLNRLYFGTDTRAVGLAVGCVAGCVLAGGIDTGRRRIGPVATGAAIAGLLTLAYMVLNVDGSEVWLYGPGFAIAAAASLTVVYAASGDGPVQRVLAVEPLAAMGRVSYGIYLWHWPVIVVLDSDRTGWSGLPLGALWVVVTSVLVAVSWFLVERPAPLPTMIRPSLGTAYAGIAVALAVVAVVITDVDRSDETIVVAATPAAPVVTSSDNRSDTSNVDPTSPTPTPAAPTDTNAVAEQPDPDAIAERRPAPGGRPLRMLVLGDSIAESLKEPELVNVGGVDVDVVNRSIIACPVTWEGRWAFDDGRLVADPSECDIDDRFAGEVAGADPDLILLMFAWPGTIAGRELADGTVVAPCDRGFDDRYGAELGRLVERFETRSAVVVATVAPPAAYTDDTQSDRPGCLNRVIRNGDFDVFEFGEWLCPGDDCTSSLPLRRDTVHFVDSPDVRAFVWPTIIERVLEAGGY